MQTSLLSIYAMYASGALSEEEMAKAFGLPLKNLRIRSTLYGNRMPLILGTLDKISRDELTRQEAAEVLGLSIREVNHLAQVWKVVRPVKAYIVERTAAEIKWEIRKKHAIDYIAGALPIEEAAELSQVSIRQMRRWVSDLVAKHFGMVFKDLKTLTDVRRRRLADEISRAESIEFHTERVVNEIVDGRRSISEEVISRLQNRGQLKGVKRV